MRDVHLLNLHSCVLWLRLLLAVLLGLLLILVVILVIPKLFLVAHRNICEVIKYLLLLRLNTIGRRRVSQIEKLEEAEMLQHLELVLEEGEVELPVAVWSDLDELGNKEGCVAILVFPHAVLIPAEELNDRLKEV